MSLFEEIGLGIGGWELGVDAFQALSLLRVARQPQLQMTSDVGPFGGEDAVQDRVSDAAVAPHRMMPQDTVFLGAQPFDRPLRAEIEVVGPQADDLAAERIEGVRQEQQLARPVDGSALPAVAIPGVADLDAVDGGDDVVVAG